MYQKKETSRIIADACRAEFNLKKHWSRLTLTTNGRKKKFISFSEAKKFAVKVLGNSMLYFYEINVWTMGK